MLKMIKEMKHLSKHWNVEREKQAKQHVEEMEDLFSSEIKDSIERSKIYRDKIELEYEDGNMPSIQVVDSTSEDAICDMYNKFSECCVLNFASYKHAGGGFIIGAMAQEEALCHVSCLYNVLSTFEDEYKWNREHLNKAMYKNFAIFSPNVMFRIGGAELDANVLTCPCPNFKAYSMYNTDMEIFDETLRSRIKFLLDVAEKHKQKRLVLGAFGCGVFKNNPLIVANIFKELLLSGNYNFEDIIFAIPNGKNGNLKAFKEVFENA